MKRILFVFAFMLFLSSCKKSGLPSVAGISYKVNGTQVQISGGIDSSQLDYNTGYYYGCYAVNHPGSSNYYVISGESKTDGALLIISTPDHLSTTTYSTGSVSLSLKIDNTPYGADAITVNISRYSNGTIDGTFSASVSDANANKKTVTDGHLNNIKVYP
jgi:hypothetical protein